jgi:hypothetical protein
LVFRRVSGAISSACRTFLTVWFQSETQSVATIQPTARA